MIRYALACDAGHEFESWFPSAASYEDQSVRGLVSCALCGSGKVEKRMMAPSIGKGAGKGGGKGGGLGGDRADDAPPSATEPKTSDPAPQPVALLSEREQAMRAMLRAVREHVAKTADYVGPSFADEARKMHYGETPHRSIYGEANAVDAQALIEEGIEVHPLPTAPDDRN